jgi:alkylhydroperoxidase family enzyme
VTHADLEPMRAAGLTDGEILEVNQVAAYFAYANRTVSGLGVTTDGDVLGMSPADTARDDWRHG